MSEEILINLTPRETRVAVVEDGILQEVLVERARKRGLVGNIYKGRVVRILPGMEAAFVDIGLERAAFLHASDISEGYKPTFGEESPSQLEQELLEPPPAVCITKLIHQGQDLIVQVIKDPLGTKGARLTTHVSIPSRYLVFLVDSDAVGISIRIEDEIERERLKDIINTFKQDMDGGYIVRTAGEHIDPWAIRSDMQFLQRLWASVKEKSQKAKSTELIYADLDLELRVVRDFINDNTLKINIDARTGFERMRAFAEQFLPDALNKIELYSGERPLFDLYNIEDEIERSLSKKVTLKSGGYLMIEQTEAMTTVDVNTGAYVGHRNLEETIFKTNLEASQAIARQLRLRNLGGIVILDFIDMQRSEHKQAVLDSLEQYLAKDHARTSVGEVTSLGLVQMTRKRIRESLEHVLCGVCPMCEGRGFVKTAETICYQIFREVIREAKQYQKVKEFLILAAPEVVELMLDEESNSVAELESFINASLRLQSESLYTVEQFDIVLM